MQPVGARLALYHPRWTALFPHSAWLLQLIYEGVSLSFINPPPLTRHPRPIQLPADPMKRQALLNEVRSLLQKKAIIEVSTPTSMGFYSHLFLVPKSDGKWRPVIDLSALNAFLSPPRFKMETARSVRNSFLQGDWAVSLDLTDAYLHIPIHQASQRYLRVAILQKVYMFRALPFGLSLSPWIFTRVMDEVLSLARTRMESMVAAYLDDFLVKNQQKHRLETDRDLLLRLLSYLGFMVSTEKSDLQPKQRFEHLGMRFDTVEYTVGLSEKRIVKIKEAITKISTKRLLSRREVTQILGLCQAAADLLPLGWMRLRPLQWATADWFEHLHDWDVPVQPRAVFLQALECWRNESWLRQTVPIRPPTPEFSLCTDASQHGWGAHLLPDFVTISGVWSEVERDLHILRLRVARRTQSSPPLATETSWQSNFNTVGQLHSSGLCKQTGRNKVKVTLRKRRLSSAICRCQGNNNVGQTHPRQTECDSRRTVQERDLPYRMDVVTELVLVDQAAVSQHDVRCLRHEVQQETDEILLAVPGPSGCPHRCPVLPVGRHRHLCVPAITTGTQGVSQAGVLSGTSNTCGSISPTQGLVYDASQQITTSPTANSSNARPANATSLRRADDGPGTPQPSCVQAIWRALKEKGYSDRAVARIVGSRRQSTLAVYHKKWQYFEKWCTEHQLDSLALTPPLLADFFVYLFEEVGLQPITIKGYRAAIARVYKLIGSAWDPGSHTHLSDLLKNVSIERPVTKRIFPKWDIDLVLRFF